MQPETKQQISIQPRTAVIFE